MASGRPVSVQIDPTSYAQVMRWLKTVNDVGYKELQKTGRKVAFEIKAAQQEAVRGLDTKGARGGGRKLRALAVYAGARDMGARSTANAARRVTSLRQAASRAVAVETRSTPGKGRTSSMRIRMRASKMAPGQERLPKHMNYGRWRHPVFAQSGVRKGAHAGAWVEQTVSPVGWFDGTFARLRPKAQAEILARTKDAYERYRAN